VNDGLTKLETASRSNKINYNKKIRAIGNTELRILHSCDRAAS
jgi:hypothetical protein